MSSQAFPRRKAGPYSGCCFVRRVGQKINEIVPAEVKDDDIRLQRSNVAFKSSCALYEVITRDAGIDDFNV